ARSASRRGGLAGDGARLQRGCDRDANRRHPVRPATATGRAVLGSPERREDRGDTGAGGPEGSRRWSTPWLTLPSVGGVRHPCGVTSMPWAELEPAQVEK